MQYVMYILPVLWMTSRFHIIERIGQNQRRSICFVQFARWRHQGRSMPSPTASCLQFPIWVCFFSHVGQSVCTTACAPGFPVSVSGLAETETNTSSCDLELLRMTLTHENELSRIKTSHHTKCLPESSFSSKVIAWKQTHTHNRETGR